MALEQFFELRGIFEIVKGCRERTVRALEPFFEK
jgi:hypothetical protein